MTTAAGATAEQAREILRLAEISGSNEEVLGQLEPLVAGSEIGRSGVAKLRELIEGVTAAGVPAERVRLDVAIARGLDYYTGTVFETFLDRLPGIGSVCSGGRYDNLAALYTDQELPGIGASLGLDRLLAAMEELNMIEEGLGAVCGLHSAVRRRPAARLLAIGGGLACRGHWRGTLSRAEEIGPAVEIRRPSRLSHCAHRRAKRVRQRRLSGEGPAACDATGCGDGAGCAERH